MERRDRRAREMKNDINLRDYFIVGRDVLRNCWNWIGPLKNGAPCLKGISARRLVRERYGHGVEPNARLSGCLLGNKKCVNPCHTYSSGTDLEHLNKFILPARKSDGCMLWTGCDLKGYPLITVDKVTRRAARVLWELRRGPIPDGFHVLHRCDTPRCMAIGEIGGDGHLWLGTPAENTRDMIEKKRGFWQRKDEPLPTLAE